MRFGVPECERGPCGLVPCGSAPRSVWERVQGKKRRIYRARTARLRSLFICELRLPVACLRFAPAPALAFGLGAPVVGDRCCRRYYKTVRCPCCALLPIRLSSDASQTTARPTAAVLAMSHGKTSTSASRAEHLVALPSLSCALSSLPQAKSLDQLSLHPSSLAHRAAESEAKVSRFSSFFPRSPSHPLLDSSKRRWPPRRGTRTRGSPQAHWVPYVPPPPSLATV